jgi:hypothetical protein
MYRVLGEKRLNTGETLEIGVVVAPDAEHADQIAPFLSHKPSPYDDHIRRSLRESLDALETCFYVGKLDGTIVTNIMTVEHVGVGILGHVFTTPHHRRKGACDAVMRQQMDDFRRRKGRVLHLGTGFGSPAYHIYRQNGFRSVFPRSGFMRYTADDDALASYFTGHDVSSREVRWSDWGPLTALTGALEGDWLRSSRFRLFGPTNFEGGFLGMRIGAESGHYQCRVLETEAQARVGFATLGTDPTWRDAFQFDALCHSAYWERLDVLWQSFDVPKSKVIAYADERSESKIDALERIGFRQEARLRGFARRRLKPDWTPSLLADVMFDGSAFDDTPLDVLVFSFNG